MRWFDRLERRMGRYGIPNLTLLLIAAQVAGFVCTTARPEVVENMSLVARSVGEGEIWRLFSFLMIPASTNPLFLFFGLYFFWLMGSALEVQWGTFRYNVYVAIAYVATLVAACLVPDDPANSGYIGGSVFLAFAFLYPDFQLSLYFILPIKVKYLAMLTWVGYLWVLTTGAWIHRALVLASICNYLLFFGLEHWRMVQGAQRRAAWQARVNAHASKPFHCCATCGITERDDRGMDFRYCNKCQGSFEYCSTHLANHEHVVRHEEPAIEKQNGSETQTGSEKKIGTGKKTSTEKRTRSKSGRLFEP